MFSARLLYSASIGIVLACQLSSPATGQGNPENGQQAFRQCSSCHSFDPDQRRPGPHL